MCSPEGSRWISALVSRQPTNIRAMPSSKLYSPYVRVCSPFPVPFSALRPDGWRTLQTATPPVRHQRRVLSLFIIWGHLTARECTRACYTRWQISEDSPFSLQALTAVPEEIGSIKRLLIKPRKRRVQPSLSASDDLPLQTLDSL